MSRHRGNARSLRAIAYSLRTTRLDVAALLERVAADILHHHMIIVPVYPRREGDAGFMVVHANADDDWSGTSWHMTREEAVAERAKMRRHWARLRKQGVDV